MQTAVITTYRCNAKCEMCYIWKHPSSVADEIKAEHLLSLPSGQRLIVVSGGEPTLRKDLAEIIDVLLPKAARLQIISNASFPERLFAIAKRYPALSFRVSIDGLPKTHDDIRGLKDGFEKCTRTLFGLRELGVKDLGIAMTVWDRNVADLMPLYEYATAHDFDFAQSAPHNSHHFHKFDNDIGDAPLWHRHVEEFMQRLLTSGRSTLRHRAKDWVRAFITYGYLVHEAQGQRLLRCAAGSEFCTINPFGDVLPCNGMPRPMSLGNIKEKPFDEIWSSPEAERVRGVVRTCNSCWMICNAAPSVRRHPVEVVSWIARHKLRAHRTRRSLQH